MILDNLDIEILRKYLKHEEDEEFSIWNFAKDYFNTEGIRETTAKYNFIISRIKRMKPFFELEKNGDLKEIYVLDDDRINLIKDYIKQRDDIIIEFIEGKEKDKFNIYRLLKSF